MHPGLLPMALCLYPCMVSLGVTCVPGAAAPQMDIALGFHYHQFQFFQGNARPL